MASTEEVLKALQNAKITTLAATEPEELVIDAESRTITVPSSERLFGVTGDMNIERKYFRCPKIVGDNIDLSTHQIFIAYVYTETESGSIFPSIGVAPYHCEDVEVDGEDITFSWKLTGNVFKNPGFILFKMYAKRTEADPNTVFNTTPAIGTVLATIPDGTEEIVEEYPDVIAQIFDRLDALESGGGGTGGTTNYENLSNKPQINGVTLEGNKTLDQVGVLAKNQGSNNSGKFLSVGSDGNVVPADAPSGGTVDPEQIKQAVNGYLEENPVSGMTEEQEQQLNQNTTDVADLKSDLEEVSKKAAGWTDSAKTALVTLIRDAAYVKNAEISDMYNTLLNELGVVPIVHATSVSLDKNNIIFGKIGNTQKIVATIIPRDTTDAISWISSNNEVATVDQNGNVISVGEGNCEITLKVGSIAATCSVNVSVGNVYSITNELKNVSTDNNSTQILKNNSYNAVLTAYEGAGAISEVSVSMGGSDITGSAYSAGEINIESVTGNIVIKAKANDNYTKGYLNDMGVIQTSNSDVLSSVYTPVQKGSDICIEAYTQKDTVKTFRINEYDAELNFIQRQYLQALGNTGFVRKFTVSDTTEYIRIGFGINNTDDDSIDALFNSYNIYTLGDIINALNDVPYTIGGLDSSGVEVEASDRIRSDYISLDNNEICLAVIVNPYTISSSSNRLYDSLKEFLSSINTYGFVENSAYCNGANAKYCRLLLITNGLNIQEDIIFYINGKFYRLVKDEG